VSITFHIAGRRNAESDDVALHVSNTNSHAFLAWLGLPNPEPAGSIAARDLTALLRRHLWPESRRRGDEGLAAAIIVGARGTTHTDGGRRRGTFARYAEELLRIADHASDGGIIWG
jgi:hypothetical protein